MVGTARIAFYILGQVKGFFFLVRKRNDLTHVSQFSFWLNANHITIRKKKMYPEHNKTCSWISESNYHRNISSFDGKIRHFSTDVLGIGPLSSMVLTFLTRYINDGLKWYDPSNLLHDKMLNNPIFCRFNASAAIKLQRLFVSELGRKVPWFVFLGGKDHVNYLAKAFKTGSCTLWM